MEPSALHPGGVTPIANGSVDRRAEGLLSSPPPRHVGILSWSYLLSLMGSTSSAIQSSFFLKLSEASKPTFAEGRLSAERAAGPSARGPSGGRRSHKYHPPLVESSLMAMSAAHTLLSQPSLTLLFESDDLSAATTPSVRLNPTPRDPGPPLTVREVSSLAKPCC